MSNRRIADSKEIGDWVGPTHLRTPAFVINLDQVDHNILANTLYLQADLRDALVACRSDI